MKRVIALWLSAAAAMLMTACANDTPPQSEDTHTASESSSFFKPVMSDGHNDNVSDSGSNDTEAPGSAKILISYFTRLDNTDASLDEIVRGGGPYGSLGNSFEEADIDAVASASITAVNGQAQGNTQTLAQMIQEAAGGDLFSIKTTESYPVDYDELIDKGGEEKNRSVRPELSYHVENMSDYDVVFIGFPNWWYDMPMAVYSFLEEYDFSGKTVIPFATSAGSGFSGAVGTIGDLLPNANVVENGLHIRMNNVSDARDRVREWLDDLDLLQ